MPVPPDEVLPASQFQGLAHQGVIFGVARLQQRPLHGLVLRVPGHEHRRHIPGIQAGVVHGSGQGAGGGIKILYLFRVEPVLPQVAGQVDGLVEAAARVGGHEIGHQILLLAVFFRQGVIFAAEVVVHIGKGLAHIVQHPGADVLRRHLQLAADMVPHQLGEKVAVFVPEHIVKADAAADEHLFDPGDGPQLPQGGQIAALIGVEIGTGCGEQALAVGAGAVLLLLLAGRVVKVGGGAAHIVDIALEIRIGGDEPCLPQHAFLAPGGHIPPLVEGQGAEIAGAEAATVVDDGKAHLLDGRHASQRLVVGVVIPGIGQVEHLVQLPALQGQSGGILDEKAAPGGLDQRPAPGEVVFILLDKGRPGIGLPILPHLFKGGQGQGVFKGAFRRVLRQKAGAADIPDGLHRLAFFQPPGDLGHAALPHAVGQKVRAAVLQNGAAHIIVPVVIVGEPAQAGLDAADDDGHAGKGLPGAVGIDDHRPVGALARQAAGGIAVPGPAALGHRIVGHHGIDVAGIDEHPQPGPAHGQEVGGAVPVGLGQDGHPEARLFQRAGDHRRAEGGMVHIGVAGDQQKVIIIPAPGGHVLPVDR